MNKYEKYDLSILISMINCKLIFVIIKMVERWKDIYFA